MMCNLSDITRTRVVVVVHMYKYSYTFRAKPVITVLDARPMSEVGFRGGEATSVHSGKSDKNDPVPLRPRKTPYSSVH